MTRNHNGHRQSRAVQWRQWGVGASGALLLMAGYLFYSMYRDHTWLHTLALTRWLQYSLPSGPDVLPLAQLGWLPSALFVLGFSLLFAAPLLNSRHLYGYPIGFMTLSVAGEGLQWFFRDGWAGTADAMDVWMSLVAGGVAMAVILLARGHHRARDVRAGRRWVKCLAATLAAISMMATSPPEGEWDSEGAQVGEFEPVYLDWEDFRTAVTVEEPTSMEKVGKIYKYRHYILVNSPNEGIHVFDNSNMRMPINIAFIYIPGNVDMAVKDDILYADSFVDLVSIDISNPVLAKEVYRVEDVFPYDAYQAIDDAVYLSGDDFESKGVVIDYVRTN